MRREGQSVLAAKERAMPGREIRGRGDQVSVGSRRKMLLKGNDSSGPVEGKNGDRVGKKSQETKKQVGQSAGGQGGGVTSRRPPQGQGV